MGEQVAARSYGGVAQLGEHLPCKQGVKSSNLSVSIGRRNENFRFRLYLENFIQKKISIDYDLYSDKLIKTSEIKCNIKNNSSN